MQQNLRNQLDISFFHQLTEHPPNISSKSSTLCVYFIRQSNHRTFNKDSCWWV